MQENTHRLTVVPMARPDRLASHGRAKRLYEIPDSELAALREDVVLCRRARALDWLNRHRSLLRSLSPGHSSTPAMIGYLAQWADSGATIARTVAELLVQLPEPERGQLPLRSYLFLRLAEGVVNLVLRKPDSGDLDFVITVGGRSCADQELLALALFWKAEAERRSASSDRPVRLASESREIAARLGYARLAARAQAVEALASLERGMPHALESLQRCGAVLRESEDWLWLGRIEDGLGRAAVDDGRYQSALDHFDAARDFLQQGPEPLSELAWAHFHGARARRLIASRLESNIDFRAALRRRSRTDIAEVSPPRAELRHRLEQLRSEAAVVLAQAETGFRSVDDRRALGFVRLEQGALWADSGDLQKAAAHARDCFALGTRHDDTLLMAQARLLESCIEKTHCEEGLGVDLAGRAQRAYEYASESLSLADVCEAPCSTKRRLLAAIYICQGLLLSSEFFNSMEAALACCQAAGKCLNPSEGDELWHDYQLLLSRTRQFGNVDARLRKWSEGLVDGKSFQQIAEEFADVVIPAVWAREGKNISRVVTKLSISPKKVRRILARVEALQLKPAGEGDLA